MGELWRDLTDLLGKRPILWLPVLVADLLGFLINFGRAAWLRSLVLSHTHYQSVLGGAPVRAPMTAGAAEGTSVEALLLTWSTYLVRILLYAGALVLTAALARGYLSRMDKPWGEVGPALRKAAGGIVELGLRALAVYAVAALLVGYVGRALLKGGHPDILRNLWAEATVALLIVGALAFTVAPAAVRVLAGRRITVGSSRQAQALAFILGAISLLLASFVAANSQALLHASAGVAIPFGIVGSLLAALPYAPMFAGLSLLARKTVREADIVPEEDPA